MEPSDPARLAEKQLMLTTHLAGRGIRDTNVLKAMNTVPREAFLSAVNVPHAYIDAPLPIEEGQTISQPYIVAKMAELAHLDSHSKVLEIGTGSGYGAAVLGQIAAEVFSVERKAKLAPQARSVLKKLGYANVTIVEGDGSRGLIEESPFDAIVVTAAAPVIPAILKEQLVLGGSLVIPAGEGPIQHLLKIKRTDVNTYERTEHGAVRFVPLIGEFGWERRHEF
ncbi:protein-L-isoaspartate(D-aspartate) O-methyltransferase [Alteromonas sp. ASW11-130]|uniref:protein-L-isoaspartate(D-aspartate) O-methyltransferase n=1 Tax=Alteromonas sp. ASW11-130 TaxID=3015775 RepID=UPI0022424526|nr:protein-L-isoaspartate(D-aspartate) O-methyltransferase [Alteromonas sp. ASW11-130]MCW8091649.1 protein-L-isoaspartate(D-aspartate) O-methyltransferase [Alteromonas sp. ASW11-130]